MKIGTIRCIPSKNQFSSFRIHCEWAVDGSLNIQFARHGRRFIISHPISDSNPRACPGHSARMALPPVNRSNRIHCLESIDRSSVVEMRPPFLQYLPDRMVPLSVAGWVKTGRPLPNRIDQPSHFTSSARPGCSCKVESKLDSLLHP